MRVGGNIRRLALSLPILYLACSSPNPASPPAPPAELPTALTFPPDIRVDLTTISAAPSSSALSALVAGGGTFSNDITFASRIAGATDDQIASFLQPLSTLNIPVSPTVTTFEGKAPFLDGTIDLKIDFSDFDLNGDGSKEGCSGCTCPVGCGASLASCPTSAPVTSVKPVCYRVWFQKDPGGPFTRFMAGRFDRLFIPDDPSTPADERRIGKGEFFGGFDSDALPPTEGRNQTHAIYDQQPPDNLLSKTNEIFNILESFDSGGHPILNLQEHATIAQTPLDSSGDPKRVSKTVNFSLKDFIGATLFNPFGPSPPPTDINYVARFREDQDFWSGTKILNPDPSSVSFTDACAFITSGNASAAANCTDAGIDVSAIPFVDFVTDAEVAFPTDFPAAPPF